MNKRTKAAAASAAKWTLILSGAFILGPIIIGLAGGTGLSGKIVAEKLVIGIAWFPILFFGLWAWGAYSKKDPMTGTPVQSTEPEDTSVEVAVEKPARNEAPTKQISKWNYVGVGVGIFMLLFLFLPQIISGTLSNQYYLGAAFWVGLIIYCSINMLRKWS
jgi:hypothetical protein